MVFSMISSVIVSSDDGDVALDEAGVPLGGAFVAGAAPRALASTFGSTPKCAATHLSCVGVGMTASTRVR